MNKQKITIFVLAVLLILVVGYLSYDIWQESKVVRDRELYGQGFVEGQDQTIVSLFEQTSECQVVPVTYNNETIRIVRVSCLQQPQQQVNNQTQ